VPFKLDAVKKDVLEEKKKEEEENSKTAKNTIIKNYDRLKGAC